MASSPKSKGAEQINSIYGDEARREIYFPSHLSLILVSEIPHFWVKFAEPKRFRFANANV
ncbi:hypothetical protein SAMD00079811_74730 [Scytonema sp. HK-05]|nr:hypothetical protein SAMD00079811_74730 [Scytonema sp. HK-05]